MGSPQFTGDPIFISTQPSLTAYRGRLLTREDGRGSAVYAAAFLRERKIVLETDLLLNPPLFRLILLHELFHFVWRRLGNAPRREFYAVLLSERESRARGELGESSGVLKAQCERAPISITSRTWRDYVCESFCDTAAWIYAGQQQTNVFTLRKRWRERRHAWFRANEMRRSWKC